MSQHSQVPLNGCEKLLGAVRLVEEMSGNRIICASTGPFLMPDHSKYLVVDMHPRWDNGNQVYNVHFNARVQTTGHPMDAKGLAKLVQETGQTHALLLALEMEQYTLTPQEYEQFCKAAQRHQAEQEPSPSQGQTM